MLKTQGTSAWVLQRLTAVLLVFVLGMHLWATHFETHGELIVFNMVRVRLQTILYMVVDYGLLGFGLYHGLNGLRNVLLDWGVGLGRRGGLWLSVCLWIVGLAFFIYGVVALLPFILG